MKKKLERFYISCPVRFEDELLRELQEIWPYLLDADGRSHAEDFTLLSQDPGGIEIQAPLHLGLQLNYFLRLAHRVLLRIDQFPVRDFPVLEKRLFGIALKDYLGDQDFSVEVSASRSRLNNEKRIAETAGRVWKKKIQESASQRVLIRVFDDEMTVSLDTTGEHLHFRGYKKSVGTASLRETLAAFCLRRMIAESSPNTLKKVQLIDPMMGSGTFLLESLIKDQALPRSFSFQAWKSTPHFLKNLAWAQNYRFPKSPFGALLGFDFDPEQVTQTQDFFSGANLNEVQLNCEDVFEDSKTGKISPEMKTWVLSNPPYGERLAMPFSGEELVEQILTKYRPEKIGLLWPEALATKLPQKISCQKQNWRQEQQVSFKNGGLSVSLATYVLVAIES